MVPPIGTFVPDHVEGKGRSIQCKQISEGLTDTLQVTKIRKVRRLKKYLGTRPDYPIFPWIDTTKGDRKSINK